MKEQTRGRSYKVRRFVGVAGGVATTALCLTFAFSAVGAALRPAASPIIDPIVLAASPQISPVHEQQRERHPVGETKHVTDTERKAVAKSTSSGCASTTSVASNAHVTLSEAATPVEPDSSLLRTASKSSRTRGQPELG